MSTLIPYEDKVKLINQLKKLRGWPVTNHGKVKIKVDVTKNDITMIRVTTKNLPESEAESKYVRRNNDN